MSDSSISVSVRVRPLTHKENGLIEPLSSNNFNSDASLTSTPSKAPLRTSRRIIDVLDDRVLIFDPPDNDPTRSFQSQTFIRPGTKRYKDQRYAFDKVFAESSSQSQVFSETTLPLIDGILDGYNATVFAYGATGCGKTHTISGTPEDPGIIIRTMNELFQRIKDVETTFNVQISLSYLEIYNEMIRDLLASPNAPTPRSGLALQESAGHKISVAGLSEHHPKTPEEVINMVIEGNRRRTQSPTMANATSSRSHAVLQINVKKRQVGHDSEQCATLSIIDLAGSERASATQNSGKRMTEGANINKSLLALGNCINALCEGVKGHIPYRNSKLTRLLKFSLGGNCRTVMIVCVSPFSQHYEDSQNTLKYANRAKNIKTKVSKNIINVDRHVREYVQMIAELREQNAKLQLVIDQRSDELSAADQRKRQASIDEVEKVKVDMKVKLQQTLPSISKGAAWDALLTTASIRAQALEYRLTILKSNNDQSNHEIAMISAMLRPLANILSQQSQARSHILNAQKSSAMLEATLKAIEVKRYDNLDTSIVDQIKQVAINCRYESQIEQEKQRVEIFKNTLNLTSNGLANTTKSIAYLGQIGNALANNINNKSIDYNKLFEIAKSLQIEYEQSNLQLSSINSNDELPPPISAVSSPTNFNGGGFQPPPPLTVNLKSLSPSSLPAISMIEPKSNMLMNLSPPRRNNTSVSFNSPKRIHRRLSNFDGKQTPQQPLKKTFRWKDEAGEGDLWESRRRQSLGKSVKPVTTIIGNNDDKDDDNKSDSGWEDVQEQQQLLQQQSQHQHQQRHQHQHQLQQQPSIRGPIRLGSSTNLSVNNNEQQQPQQPQRRSSSIAMRPLGSKPTLTKKPSSNLSNVGEDEEISFGNNNNSNNGSPMKISPVKRVALTDLPSSTTSSPTRPLRGFAQPTASSARRLSKLPEATSLTTPRTARRLRRGSNIGPMRRGRASLQNNNNNSLNDNNNANTSLSSSLLPQPASSTILNNSNHHHPSSSTNTAGPVRFNPSSSLKSPRKMGRRSLMPNNNGNSRRISTSFSDFSFTKPNWK